MIIDCREWSDPETRQRERRRVFVDEVEILKVWYVDTGKGLVKTYDVLPNTAPATPTERGVGIRPWTASDFPGRDIEAPPDGVLSETLYGKVEVVPFEETA